MGTRDRRAPLLPRIVATGFGSGYAPKAPGTVGTAAALGIYALYAPWATPLMDVVLGVGMTLASVWAAGHVAAAMGVKDPQIVVSDEFCGLMISLALLPKTWPWLLAAFVLFRAFDIVKPWPCKKLEELPGGWGVTMDDAMAGVYVNLILQGVRWGSAG